MLTRCQHDSGIAGKGNIMRNWKSLAVVFSLCRLVLGISLLVIATLAAFHRDFAEAAYWMALYLAIKL